MKKRKDLCCRGVSDRSLDSSEQKQLTFGVDAAIINVVNEHIEMAAQTCR
jgi:hypothetical protein